MNLKDKDIDSNLKKSQTKAFEKHPIKTETHLNILKNLITFIAIAWALFQLSIVKFVILGSEVVRVAHLSFALALVFLCFPFLTSKDSKKESLTRKTILINMATALFAVISTCYVIFDYEGIASRFGSPNATDLFFGISLIILLLDASRRVLGKALPILASLFMFYCMIAESMPSVFAFKSRDISYVISKLYMGTEGIFGVPLDVSANTVFLFVLFGAMLEKSGGGKFFVNIAISMLGHFRGGAAKASVLASGLTGMISGSSIANTVATGTFTIPLMKKSGYPGVKAAAIEVAASTNGQLMPPIMGAAAFIIAEYCRISYFEVVRAAFIPAIISYLALLFITDIESAKLGLKGLPKADLPDFMKTLKSGIGYIIPLFFLLFELIIMRHSAGLAAFWAICMLALIIVYKSIKETHDEKESIQAGFLKALKMLGDSLIQGSKSMMGIAVAVATAGIIVGTVTMGFGQLLTDIVSRLASGNIFLILLLTGFASLVLGMGLPTTATYIVMASLTAGVIVKLASLSGFVIPLISAHLFCFYFGILADDTPPVGLAAYAAAAISKSDPIKTGIQGFIYDLRTALLPFIFIFNSEIILLKRVNGEFLPIGNWFQIGLIFIMSLIAMISFASVTQNYFLRKNRFYESLILVATCFLLFYPHFFNKSVSWDIKYLWYTIGCSLFAIVFWLQKKNNI